MDNRRLNTGQVLNTGILDINAPESKCPENAKKTSVEEFEWSEDTLLEGLKGGGLTGCIYYGCWDIWKTDKGFSGELMQYRSCTDEFKDKDINFALEKAQEWASGCQG